MATFPTVSTGAVNTICAINPALCGFNPAPASNYPVKITTPQMKSGQTTLDKILSTTLSLFALHKQAPYVPTTTQPAQPTYNPYPTNYDPNQVAIGGGAGATLGASLESFVANNTGILLVGVVAAVLFKSGRK
jgi:hypothetical protein